MNLEAAADIGVTFSNIDDTPVQHAIAVIGTGLAVSTTQAIAGATVMLTVTAAVGYRFVDFSTTPINLVITPVQGQANQFSFIMPSVPVSIEANFEELPPGIHNITVGTGITSIPSFAAEGDTVTFMLNIPPGHTHDAETGWTVTPNTLVLTRAGTTNEWSFTMPDEAVSVTPIFAPIPFEIITGENVSAPDTATVGQEVTVSVSLPEHFEFYEWYEAPSDITRVGNTNEFTFIMPAEAVTLTATFSRIQFEIEVEIVGNGTVSGYGYVGSGLEAELIANIGTTTNSEMRVRFIGWFEDDELVYTGTTYTFIVSENRQLEARFEEAGLAVLMFSYIGGGSVLINIPVDPNYQYFVGTEITATAVADEDSIFYGWLDDEDNFMHSNPIHIVTLETGDFVVLTAKFVSSAYTAGLVFTRVVGTVTPEYQVAGAGLSGMIIVPAMFGEYPVTRVANGGFANNINITRIILPDSITHFDAFSFNNSSNLRELNIPASLTTLMGNSIFANTALTSIVLPDAITSIPAWTFNNARQLRSIVLPSTITTIGASAFRETHALEDISLPEGLVDIGTDVFHGSGIKNITIHERIVDGVAQPFVIPNGAFQNTTRLETITFPNSVTSIGTNAFMGSALPAFTVPLGVTTLTTSFSNMTNLRTVTLHSGITEIAVSAFGVIHNVANFNITALMPDNDGLYLMDANGNAALTIGNTGFVVRREGNSHTIIFALGAAARIPNVPPLESLIPFAANIPLSITHIANSVFMGSENLISVTFPNSLTHIGDNAFMNTPNTSGNLVIPNSVISIGTDAFASTRFAVVTLPNGLIVISDRLFSGNTALTTINIPSTVTRIGVAAFSGATHLADVGSIASVTEIDNNAFQNSGLSTITLPDGLVRIGVSAFAGTQLTTITIPSTVNIIGDNAFNGVTVLTSVIIEGGAAAEGSIGTGAFQNIRITTITIPGRFRTIGNNAFLQVNTLTTLVIQDGVLTIGNNAFEGLTALVNITLPNSITAINQQAFRNAGLSGELAIDSLASVGVSAFENTNLISVVLPASMTAIGNNAFSNITTLTAVRLPTSVTGVIGANLFAGSPIIDF